MPSIHHGAAPVEPGRPILPAAAAAGRAASAADLRILGHTGDTAIEKLLRDALALPREERARLANALQESLEPDGEAAVRDAEWETAWSAEIERRLRDFDAGRTTAISLEEFERRMRARLPRQ